MSGPLVGDSIARRHIAELAERRTGLADPGGLVSTELPVELFGLRHAAKMLGHRRDTFFAKLIPGGRGTPDAVSVLDCTA